MKKLFFIFTLSLFAWLGMAQTQTSLHIVGAAVDCGWIRILEFEIYQHVVDDDSPNQTFYFDFGPTSGEGAVTVNPDSNNNYWNNISNSSSGLTMTPLVSYDLVNSQNGSVEYKLEITKAFKTNTGGQGGLKAPNEDLLDDLAVATATQDYFYVENANATFKIKNLDAEKKYKFYIFGSRSGSEERVSKFTLTGATQVIESLQTTGYANNEGNTSNVFTTDFIFPNSDGEISLELVNEKSSFGYLNAMKVEEYVDGSVVRAESITLSGEDITESGQTTQISAEVLPADATYPAIVWEVDDLSIARIDNKGLLSPKANGKVTVTGSIVYRDLTLSDEIEINISGQLGSVYFTGTASEDENPVEMHMITDQQGTITNQFELYTSLKGSGSHSLYRDLGNGNTLEYGAGDSDGTLAENGPVISSTIDGPVRITVDLTAMTYTILPVTSLNIVGSSVHTGTDVTKGLSLVYQGEGIWSAPITFNSGTNNSFNFIINKSAQECLKRIKGTNQVVSQTQGSKYGISLEDIRTNMNGGDFEVTLDLRNYTYSVSCGEVNDFQISYMGSSVCSGAGALNNDGYAYMYTNLLKQRYEQGLGLDWKTSNVSIGGNTTTNLLDRWERDLLTDCSRYVIYGLSLGNEGIHERGEPAYISYRDGMLKAIEQAEDAGIVPVIANNYTRADFNASDYNYVKQLNLLIHEWDLPSINTLGAIDDGAGRWANGYENDNAHPNTAGHEEFFYAMVPSLFDALEAGKPLPERATGELPFYTLGRTVSANRIEFTPEHIVHPFTISFDINTTDAGIVASFENEIGNGFIKIDNEGHLVYESPKKGSVRSSTSVATGVWHCVTLTHYYAWGVTVLYVDKVKVGELYEKLVPKKFALAGASAPDEIKYRELFFWRAGMNAEEIDYLNEGKMLKSSLELYAVLDENAPLVNLAQSTNTIHLANTSMVFDQKMYIDFGKNDGNNGSTTASPDTNGNAWNNVYAVSSGTVCNLVNSKEISTGYELKLTTGFMANGKQNGGLLAPDPALLGDLAIATATEDYFYIEKGNGSEKGGIDFNNLDPQKAYKFYVFGSRYDAGERTGQLTFTGTNVYTGTHQMSGSNIAVGNVPDNVKNQNNSTIFVSDYLFPDATGTIHFELARLVGNFAHINAMKIEEFSSVEPEGDSPLISVTPADGLGVRIARIYSNTGGFNNEGAENLLLDKTLSANKTKKWCYNASAHEVIIELSDFYDVDKFFIEDARTREPGQPNMPEYYIYVSSTGIAGNDWLEVVHEINQSNVMYKEARIAPTKARYIKLVPKGIDVIRIYNFEIYGKKSFDSAHSSELISVGKKVVEQTDSPNIQQAAVALFDGNINAANSRWAPSTGGNKSIVLDLEDNYSISEFKLYDALSAGSGQNINGYKLSVSSDLSTWDLLVDETNRGGDNIKTDAITPTKVARYVKLEIPEDRMGSNKAVELYEFSIYGKYLSSNDDAALSALSVSGNTLTPSFDPDRTSYTLNVAKEVEAVTIQASARNENATIAGDLNEKSLTLGENDFTITVTAADGITKKQYFLTVNRAEKSALAGLTSLSVDDVSLTPDFSPSTLVYRVGVDKTSVEVKAETTSPHATVTGIGVQSLSDGANYITVTVTSEDESHSVSYNVTVYNTSRLISLASPDGLGKRVVNVDSYSGMTQVNENPYRVLRGWKENLSGNTQMKWCDTSDQPWIIFSLSDIYTINHIEIRDCKMVESGWANIPQYSVYVSTTDTLDGCWTEIINEQAVSTVNEKIKSFDPVEARFVKFVPAKGDNAIRVYGFDIYGEFSRTIDRGGLISVGKTIKASSSCTSDMATPANILDGRESGPWEFTRADAYVEIDLGQEYDLGRFVIVDSSPWLKGYAVSVSNTGNGTDWKEIAAPTFDTKTDIRKEVSLAAPESARYVRLDISRANQYATSQIKEFEIYLYDGNKIAAVDNSESNLKIYPNPVSAGSEFYVEGSGLLKVYTLQGALFLQQEINEEAKISTASFSPGYYILQLGEERAKLLVK